MISVFLAIALWIPALVGFGIPLIAVGNRSGSSGCEPLVIYAVAGMAVLSTVVNIANFVVPITLSVEIAVLCIGWILFVVQGRNALRFGRPDLAATIFSVLTLVCIAWLAVQFPFRIYDSGLYHIQAIKWTVESAIPFGLGNLHGRLAFNSNWFSVASVLGIPGIPNSGFFTLNATLLIAYGISIGYAISKFRVGTKTELSEIFFVSTGIAWLYLLNGVSVGVAATDTACIILVLLTVYVLLRGMEASKSELSRYVFLSCLLPFFAVTIKLSTAPLLLAPILLAHYHMRSPSGQTAKYSRERLRSLITITGLAAGLVLPWVARGIAMSGCLAYPIEFTCLHDFRWSVSREQIAQEVLGIKAWALVPGDAATTLSNHDWIIPWIRTVVTSRGFMATTALSLAGIVLAAVSRRRIPFQREKRRGIFWHAIVLPVSGIFYWLITAPTFRFGSGYFWSLGLLLLSAGILDFSLSHTSWLDSRVKWMVSRGVYYAALIGLLVTTLLGTNREFFRQRFVVPPDFPKVETRILLTTQGVRIHVPETGENCWSAPIPCAPAMPAKFEAIVGSGGRHVMFYRR